MSWWSRRKREQDLERELRADLELEAAEHQDLSPEESRHAARRALGNMTLIQEDTREMWGWTSLERSWQDVRFAMRLFRKAPGFTTVALLSLALGIGANTAVFSLMDAVLLKSLPVREPDSLRILTWVRTGKEPVPSHSGYSTREQKTGLRVSGSFPYPAYQLFRSTIPQFSDLIAFAGTQFTVTAGESSEYANGQLVSDNYFTGVGVQPFMGRTISPSDDLGSGASVVLSYRYWQRRFGGDPGAIGREIAVNQRPVTIAGVLPPNFQGLYPGQAIDLFVPLGMVDELGTPWFSKSKPNNWWVQIFGRLKPGISDEAAAGALRAALSGIIRGYAPNVADSAIPRVVLAAGGRGVGVFRNFWSTRLYILSATSGLILLIACVNLANLLLARAAGRRHEIAVRLSIGARRGRLLRQLFTESLLLALAGGLVAVTLAKPLANVLIRYAGGNRPLSLDAHIDLRSLAFAFGLCLLTALVFGVGPAWRATRIDLSPAMKSRDHPAARSGARMPIGRALVSVQVALSVLLLVGAGLFVRTLVSLANVDLGFRAEHLLTFQTDGSRSGLKGLRLAGVYARIEERIAGIPGVESVGMSQHGLIQGVVSSSSLYIPGRPATEGDRSSDLLFCSNAFLRTMGIPIVMGRDFATTDGATSRSVAIVNESFAKQYFNRTNPAGETFFLGDGKNRESLEGPFTIVGVAKNAHYNEVRGEVASIAYIPYAQRLAGLRQMTFVIRSVVPPLSIASAVRRAVADVDNAIPVAELRTQEDQIQDSLATERLFAGLVGSFGALAAMLAAIGIYGVLAYSVARRTAEIGIRIALGAREGQVHSLVVGESLLMVVIGMVVGIPAALALARLVKGMLYGVTPADPMSVAIALLVMLVVTAIAAWVPARRAARVDPARALRCE